MNGQGGHLVRGHGVRLRKKREREREGGREKRRENQQNINL
jgi:hypothetical protein